MVVLVLRFGCLKEDRSKFLLVSARVILIILNICLVQKEQSFESIKEVE